jgi:20S proteasome alpha/beta subunit
MRTSLEKMSEWLITLTTTLLFFMIIVVTSSSSSSSSSFYYSNNYNVYQYDRTSSHFTPDGRLMQVEYARSAADHSSPLIVFQYKSNTNNGGGSDDKEEEEDELLILLTLKRRSSSSSSGSPTTNSNTGSSSSGSSSPFLQERIVVLPENECILVLSGILSDCTRLLNKLQDEDLQHRRLYGGCAFCSPLKIASCLSYACQKHAIGGGIRPFGSTFFIAAANQPTTGLAPSSSSFSSSPFELYQTDPSGAVQSLPVGIGAGAGDSTSSPPPLILGGAYVEGTDRLRRRLTTEWSRLLSNNNKQETTTVASLLIAVTRILLQEQQPSQTASSSSTTATEVAILPLQPPPPPSSLEVAVISVKHGLYKLSETQIRDILQKACGAAVQESTTLNGNKAT